MTTPPAKPDPNEADSHDVLASKARLWSTAHFTLATLLAVTIVWCGLRLPGNTYDIVPWPVPARGWYLWGVGLLYLASAALVHIRLGAALRRRGTIYRREWIVLMAANSAVTLCATYSLLRGHASPAYAFGLETLTNSLCVASGLSALMIAATGVRWRHNLVPGKPLPTRVATTMAFNASLAAVTAFLLIQLERNEVPRGEKPVELPYVQLDSHVRGDRTKECKRIQRGLVGAERCEAASFYYTADCCVLARIFRTEFDRKMWAGISRDLIFLPNIFLPKCFLVAAQAASFNGKPQATVFWISCSLTTPTPSACR